MRKTHKDLKPGDPVSWNTPQGQTSGKVKEKLTRPTKIQDHKVNASMEEPEYLVQSSKSGKLAAHKPNALKRKPKQA